MPDETTPRTSICLSGFLVAAAALATGAPAQDHRVDFAREVLPILSDKCFACHGPDTREEGLVRLDSRAGATSDLGGYRAIDPAALEDSEILARIHDAGDPMPPADSGKRLTDHERGLIDRWVREGGEYAGHWAFTPPTRGASSAASIDEHVAARLAARGLDLAPEADPATLARRAALVLTGLPPEPAQLGRFLADPRPGAYEQLVDELLDDPRYGEHQARYWLDAVRYGDTHGLHLDNRRGIYPYRDWVVRAFNQNLPLDDFVTWQLAGDLLPDPSLEQRVATGYVRLNPSTAEGGAIPEEFQAKNSFDRTETFGTVMLGMTLTCARCHTHKYDPITQREYYRLLAYFDSTAEASMDGNRYEYAPVVRAPGDQDGWRRWQELEPEIRALTRAGRELHAAQQVEWRDHAKQAAGYRATDWRISDKVAGDKVAGGEVTGAAPPAGSDGWQAAKGLPGTVPKLSLGAEQVVWIEASLAAAVDQVLWLELSGGPRSAVWLDDVAVAAAVQPSGALAATPLRLAPGAHRLRIRLAGRDQATPVSVELVDPWQTLARGGDWDACSPGEQLRMLADPLAPLGDEPEREEFRARARELGSRLDALQQAYTTTLVARELDRRRPTRILARGEYDLPTGEPLEPGVPEVMGVPVEGQPTDRLGLARWLVGPEHPLLARVLVNRFWQRVFGHGLVRTPEDFGLQGEQPTHPELLDWLAVELRESGWDMQHVLRLMVTSRTFRQSSAWRDDVDDPENRLLARGPSHRLDAEVIRDVALWASGLLDPTMGGEGVKPYQPDGMWAALAHPASNTKRYVPDTGRRTYRRSLYVYWKRTSPHPMMTLFDAPSREVSCVRRSRTSTPLQSLGLLNESQRLEMAVALGQRLLREAPDRDARIDLLFRLLTCRAPTGRERAVCGELLATMRSGYAARPADAEALLGRLGEGRDTDLDPAEHAAHAQLAITVLASDLALTVY